MRVPNGTWLKRSPAVTLTPPLLTDIMLNSKGGVRFLKTLASSLEGRGRKVRKIDVKELIKNIDKNRLPKHIAIIMDGNGRWAKERNLPILKGHFKGVEIVKKIVRFSGEIGIEILTLFAFSTENWARPKGEIRGLMSFLARFLKKETKNLKKDNVKLIASGQIWRLPGFVKKELKNSIETTKNLTGLIFNLCLSYGGREEICNAAKRIAEDYKSGGIKKEDIDENLFPKYLYSSRNPDPDLLIRTSGEFRISNFFLYQCAYTEFYITPVLWPDFEEKVFIDAIIEYQRRKRRFGRR